MLRIAAALAVFAVALTPALAQTPTGPVVYTGQAGATVFAASPNDPEDLVQLSDGRVLVAEFGGDIVSAFASDGTPLGTFASIRSPAHSVAELSNGHVLVSNSNGEVLEFEADGTLLGTFANGLIEPYGLLQLADGRVLVADSGNRRVVVISDATGAPVTPTAFAIDLAFPYDIVQLVDGRVLISEQRDGEISAFAADGTPLGTFATGLSDPYGLTAQPDGRILVFENPRLGGRVLAFSPDGTNRRIYRTGIDRGFGFLTVLADEHASVGNGDDSGVLALSGTEEGFYQVAAPGVAETVGGRAGGVLDPLHTQGYPGADYVTGDANVARYSEPVDGDLNTGYVAPASSADDFPAGTGLYVYVFADTDADGDPEDAPFALPLVSAEPTLPFAFPITYSDNADGGDDLGNDDTDDGWNMLGNPIRERISWGTTWLATGTRDVEPTAYAYDPVANSYSAYNADIRDGTGDVISDGFILPGQGFYVRASAPNPVLEAPTNATSEPPPPQGTRLAAGGGSPHVRLAISGTAAADPARRVSSEMMVALVEGGTLGRDRLDAVYLGGVGEPLVGIAGLAEDSEAPLTHVVLPAPAALGGGAEVALALGAAGVAEARLTWSLDLPDGWTAALVDRQTGAAHALEAAPAGARAARPSLALDVSGLGATPEAGRYALRLSAAATASEVAPAVATVSAPWPNPAAGGARLAVTVPGRERVRVAVYDALGREVAVAFEGVVSGRAEVAVGAGLAAGVYVVRVAGATFAESRALTVLR